MIEVYDGAQRVKQYGDSVGQKMLASFRSMEIGQSIQIPLGWRNQIYAYAAQAGISVSGRKISGEALEVTRFK